MPTAAPSTSSGSAVEAGPASSSSSASSSSGRDGFKRVKPDPAVDSGLLATPNLFVQVPQRPRLMPIVEKGRPTNPGRAGPPSADGASGDGSGAAASSSSAGAGASASSSSTTEVSEHVVVTRTPTLVHLDDYLDLVGRMYYGPKEVGGSTSDFSLVRRTTLGRLTSQVRAGSVLDRWTPLEIARFEAAICLVGKAFANIATAIGTDKTGEDVIEFYYMWKQSKNYQAWKASYRHDPSQGLEY